MMKSVQKRVALFVSRLTLSPSTVELGSRWKIGQEYVRIIGMLVSPLSLIIYLMCL